MKRRWLQNFSSLTAVNAINISLPFFLIPYLIRVLGADQYGALALHQYAAQFAGAIIDFGFPLYAVGEVSRRASNKAALSRLVVTVTSIKLILLAAVGMFAAVIASTDWAHSRLSIEPALLALCLIQAAVVSFQPLWLLQGLQNVKAAVIPTLITRLFTLVGTMAFLRSPSDILVAPALQILGGVALLIWTGHICKPHVDFAVRPNKQEHLEIFRRSLEVFWSRLLILGYALASPFIVQMSIGPSGVTVYNMCEKLISVMRMPFDIASNSLYPILAQTYCKKQSRKYLQRFAVTGFVFSLILFILLTLFSDWLDKKAMVAWTYHAKWYSISLLAIACHGYIGVNALIAQGHRNALTLSILLGLIAYYLVFTSLRNNGIGDLTTVIAAMVAVEFTILTSRWITARTKHLL